MTARLALLLLASAGSLVASGARFGGATATEWSQRLARSEMTRQGDALFAGATPKSRWDYTNGLFALSLHSLGAQTRDDAMRDFGARIVSTYIGADGTIRTYKLEDYNIDMITPGRVALLLWQETRDERFRLAADRLRSQLRAHPRTSEGGFWHKQRYPHQMWLDGLYMASPFYAHYGVLFNEPEALDDVARQLILMDRHAFDPARGIHLHAWDEARAQPWADKTHGRSPNVWARAVGWYVMALVDSLDHFSALHHDVESLVEILNRTAAGIARYQDPKTGLWWQVLDQGGREGNYLESTAASMYVYALAKAINKGYLPRDRYLPVVQRGYEGIVRDFLRTDPDGSVSLTRCCQVAGLGYTNAAGRSRDGSFDYYISEPIIDNDLKGVGPFILAGPEVDRLFSTPAEAAPLRVTGWESLPAVLARIKDPVFPARDFPITSYGAAPGSDASAAIRAAIDACHAAGGGRVVVPPGDWPTGAIHLKSNVKLHVSEGATLRFSTAPSDYPMVFTRWEGMECMNYSPLIYAYGQENIAVTGKGVLDGQADWDTWWGWNNKKAGPVKQKAGRDRLFSMAEAGVPVAERVMGEGAFLRPNFIQPYRCRNVLIEGVRIVRSPMWEVHPVLCENVTVRGLHIETHGPNNDGVDPESCRDVLIEDTYFDTGDDCIAIKSGRNNDGRRVGVASENIVIRRCTMKAGHGGVVIGSEISGGCRNVFVEDCVMDSPDLDRALRFKSNARRGGELENIFMRRVKVGRVAEAILTVDFLYEEGADGAHPPSLRNVRLEAIESESSPRVLWIAGFPGAVIDGIRISDSVFRGVETAEVVSGAGLIQFNRVVIEPKVKPRGLNSVPKPETPRNP